MPYAEQNAARLPGVGTVIGGRFGLEGAIRPQERPPSFLTGRDLFLVNGRCGIWLLIERLRPSQVWVPSYLCRQGILEAIDTRRTVPRFYEVDYDLSVPSDRWISEVSRGDLVILIDYFGFPYDPRLAAEVKERGAWILEDACQALLSGHVGTRSDFVLFNVAKWIGVPDGAILRYPESFPLDDIPMKAPAPAWWLKALQSSVLRREFDYGSSTREWFTLFRETEEAMPTGPYAMSEIAQTIMKYSVDYPSIAVRRRENYCALLRRLEACAMFPDIGPDVVPLGFPVRVARRDAVRRALFDHGIYPPVHWQLDGVVPSRFKGSLRLSGDIMTLPCDQRYGPEDMERLAEIFLQTLPRALHAAFGGRRRLANVSGTFGDSAPAGRSALEAIRAMDGSASPCDMPAGMELSCSPAMDGGPGLAEQTPSAMNTGVNEGQS